MKHNLLIGQVTTGIRAKWISTQLNVFQCSELAQWSESVAVYNNENSVFL